MKTVFFELLMFLCLFIFVILITSKKEREKELVSYNITIVDEHEVRLTTKNDTIILLFENASVLSDENVIFVKR